MNWQVAYGNGIELPEIGWLLDARKPAENVFVSHAHFDHLGNHRAILCTPTTKALIQERQPGDREWIVREFQEEFEIEPGVRAMLYPAGHIFGSAMLWIEMNGTSLLYTGDFKLGQNPSGEDCIVPEADEVIVETTFGLPRYTLPPSSEVIADIIRFCADTLDNGDTPVLFGYSLGKSQTILQALANSDFALMLHPQPYKITKTCETLGYVFPPYSEFDKDRQANHVIIAPPLSKNATWLQGIRNPKTAMISGWAVDSSATYRYACDKAFPLSDHADYLDLQEFIAKSNPKRVYTTHGFASAFAATLREQGIEALALGKENQLALEIDPPKASPQSTETQSATESAKNEIGQPNAFREFAKTAESIDRTDSQKRIVGFLTDYLATLEPENVADACQFFTGSPFSRSSQKELGLNLAAVKQSIQFASDTSESEFRALLKNLGNSESVAIALLERIGNSSTKSLRDMRVAFNSLATAPSPHFKQSFLSEVFRKLSPSEGKWMMRIISGDLRIGLEIERIEDAISNRFDIPSEEIREARLRCGDVRTIVMAAAEKRLDEIDIAPFTPIQFMQARRAADATAIIERMGEVVWAEDKLDGIPCQIHKVGERLELFDQELLPIAHQFPEIAEALRMLPKDFIGEGAIIAWRDERSLPLSELQKRLGRKGEDLFLGEEVPVILWLYDIVWLNETSLLKMPLSERRDLLDGITVNSRVRITAVTHLNGPKAIENARDAACARGNQGIVIKEPTSLYRPGARTPDWTTLEKDERS